MNLHRHHAIRTGDDLTAGERAAEWLAEKLGSWSYLIGQNLAVALWMAANLAAWAYRWDPYPFILLNLVFSWQAANTGPILQMTGNRATNRQTEMLADLHRMADCMHRSPATGDCSCRPPVQ